MMIETFCIFVVVLRIPRSFSVTISEFLENNAPITGSSSITHRSIVRAKNFASNLKNVNEAIVIFVREYELQHGMPVYGISSLEKTRLFETGMGLIYGIIKLKFSYLKNGQVIQSSVFMKVPELGAWYHVGLELSHYTKERYMYNVILPLMFSLSPYESLSPNFYSVSDNESMSILVLENLRESGFYTTVPQLHNFPQCLLVLRSLAQFHALSISRVDVFSMHNLDRMTISNRAKYVLKDRFSFILFTKFVKHHVRPLLSDDMNKEIGIMVHNAVSIFNSAFLPNEGGFNVILHGDPCLTTVFFEGNIKTDPTKCKFVDFQNSRRGSPVLDLISYLMNSVPFDIYLSQMDHLIQFYAIELRKSLQELNVNIQYHKYGYKEILNDIQKYKYYFIFRLITTAPLHWLHFVPINAQTDRDDIYDILYKSRMYVKIFKAWMNAFSKIDHVSN